MNVLDLVLLVEIIFLCMIVVRSCLKELLLLFTRTFVQSLIMAVCWFYTYPASGENLAVIRTVAALKLDADSRYLKTDLNLVFCSATASSGALCTNVDFLWCRNFIFLWAVLGDFKL